MMLEMEKRLIDYVSRNKSAIEQSMDMARRIALPVSAMASLYDAMEKATNIHVDKMRQINNTFRRIADTSIKPYLEFAERLNNSMAKTFMEAADYMEKAYKLPSLQDAFAAIEKIQNIKVPEAILREHARTFDRARQLALFAEEALRKDVQQAGAVGTVTDTITEIAAELTSEKEAAHLNLVLNNCIVNIQQAAPKRWVQYAISFLLSILAGLFLIAFEKGCDSLLSDAPLRILDTRHGERVDAAWQTCKVRDVSEFIRGVTYKKDMAREDPSDGYVPILRANNISTVLNYDSLVYVPADCVSTAQRIVSGDIVFAMSSGSKHLVGKSAQAGAGFHGSFGAFCGVIRPSGEICPGYVAMFFQSPAYRGFIAKLSTGININNLRRDDILDLDFPLPPLPEQHRIVAKIEELFSDLDAGIASLKKAKEQLKTYRQSVLKWAFEGKLTEEWREKNKPEPAGELLKRIKAEREKKYREECEKAKKEGKRPPKKMKDLPPISENELAGLPELPQGWEWVHAELISEFITKGTTPNKHFLHAATGEVPFIKVYNLTDNGSLDFTVNPTYTDVNTHRGFLARSIVYPGDVLMNIVGPPLGKASVVPDTHSEWNINQAIARYRPYRQVDISFLKYYLLAEWTVRLMMSRSKATAGQFNLTLEICRELPFPLCSEQEQRLVVSEIESRLSVADNLEKTIDESLAKADALRQSILKRAFEGKLVPQDPNDEPAEMLLERICRAKNR